MTSNSPSKRLFVGSLPYNKFTEGDLLKLFVTVGKVIDVRIIHTRWGKSQGFGYVEFENLEDAIKAKEKFNNYRLNDRTIIVDFSRPDPFLTKEGQQRHEEAQARRQKKFKNFTPKNESHPHRFSIDQVTDKKKPTKKIRQTVYDSRRHGARVGAKFAARQRKNKVK